MATAESLQSPRRGGETQLRWLLLSLYETTKLDATVELLQTSTSVRVQMRCQPMGWLIVGEL